MTSTAVAVQVITPGPQVPILPFNIGLYTGEPLSLDASSTGIEPLAYQWLFNGVPLFGETLPVFQRTLVSEQEGGVYSAQITDGAGGIATAGPVTVAVLPLPVLRWIQFTPGAGGSLEVSVVPGRGYRLQSRPAVDSGAWGEVSSAVATETVLRFEVAQSALVSQFFRVIALPIAP